MSKIIVSNSPDRGAMAIAAAMPSFHLPLTRHAKSRCKQRGISTDVIKLVMANFDRDCEAREGAMAISISRRRLRELEVQGVPVVLIERAARTVLIVAADGGV